MSKFGIICEFNPLHNGHEYLIKRSEELGATNVVCIMSGNFTQRGEFPITDKYSRAEMAIKGGADLVLELPFPWCGASAEYFASAAVSIAASFCDKLLFGSECGDIDVLKNAADICEREDFSAEYSHLISNGEGAAVAFASCLEKRGITNISSNDLLGVAYIRAIKRLKLNLEPITIKRQGSDYNSDTIGDSVYQAATAIRNEISCGNEVSMHIPQYSDEIISRELKKGRTTSIKNVEKAILGFFRVSDVGDFDEICDAGGGIGNRLIRAARESVTYDSMLEYAKTKRYTDAKLRRAIIFCMTGVKVSDVKALPEYTILLAANNQGRKLLSENRKIESINVITKSADAPDTRQTDLSYKLNCIFGLASYEPAPLDEFYKKNAYIEK